jgi:hypothetical protein
MKVKIIPLINTVRGESFPVGRGRPFVRSIIASISLSIYIFNAVVPETARNSERINNKKSNQLKRTDDSTAVIKYENTAVYIRSMVCLAFISSP